jgi:hypothetical protein
MRRNTVLVLLGFVLFVVGGVAAVVGVQASRSADDDLAAAQQDLADAEDRLDAVEPDVEEMTAAVEEARGDTADSLVAAQEVLTAGSDLCGCDQHLTDLTQRERQALLDGRFRRYNQLNDQLSVWLADSNVALDRIRLLIDQIQPVSP